MKRISIAASLVLLLSAALSSLPSLAAQGPPNVKAPATYKVAFDTTAGKFVVAVTRSQAPHGADRLYNLVKAKYFDGARFYRVVPNFVVQWGAAAKPAVTSFWDVNIPDDPVKATNARGTLSFAATGEPNSRSTHMFINLVDNARLDGMGFSPVGKVTGNGMAVVDKIYAGYGEQPQQDQIAARGNAYLVKEFPKLDYIKTARIVQ
jgi:peptidyl-prolyl cis-trans isomerase A (cyclophilin A)